MGEESQRGAPPSAQKQLRMADEPAKELGGSSSADDESTSPPKKGGGGLFGCCGGGGAKGGFDDTVMDPAEGGESFKSDASGGQSFSKKSALRPTERYSATPKSALRKSESSRGSRGSKASADLKSNLRKSINLSEIAPIRLISLRVEQRAFDGARAAPLVSLRIVSCGALQKV